MTLGRMCLVVATVAVWAGGPVPAWAGPGEDQGAVPASPVLQVSHHAEGDRQVIEIRGPGAGRHTLERLGNGTFALRFERARLPDQARAAVAPLRFGTGDPQSLIIPAGLRLSSLQSEPSLLRLVLDPLTGPAPGEYRLGVGDKVRLNIYGDDEFKNKEMRIVDDGTLSVPYLGAVQIAGLTVTEAAAEISRRLSAGYLVEPKVGLEVVEYQSQWVNVSGQVARPGRYVLEGTTRLMDIIARAGGLRNEAGNEIRITRRETAGAGHRVIVFDRNSLYQADGPHENPVLESGDTITVSPEEYFFIKGEVRSPGRYPLGAHTTILTAISLAGGFEQYANQKKIEVLRKQGDETIRLVINVERIENRKDDDVPLLPGDIINVKTRFL
ncbi:MAG: polysaccharide biosynthesis/export family protein [Acidobacteriota bacterium]